MKNLLVSLIAACVSTSALAESYLCISEAAGGVAWENGNWVSGRFKAGEKYLLKGNAWYKFGVKFPDVDSCETVKAYGETLKQCTGSYSHARFNKSTLRFSYFYLPGFTNGKDRDSDTPFVAVGTCSKID